MLNHKTTNKMKVTLGGDRVGSGNKMQVRLRNYNRSTHNLSETFTTSAAAGVLYPFLKIPAMRGDAFDIDLDAACLTLPTQGPLFGSFKLQLDLYQCPWRLYQAIMHNNPTAIGLRANQIMLPMAKYVTYEGTEQGHAKTAGKFKENSLVKYLGLSGIGRIARTSPGQTTLQRQLQCIPMLAYYDIFKNYYSNKQEENAYVIGYTQKDYYGEIFKLNIDSLSFVGVSVPIYINSNVNNSDITANLNYEPNGTDDALRWLVVELETDTAIQNLTFDIGYAYGNDDDESSISDTLQSFINNGFAVLEKTKKGYRVQFDMFKIVQNEENSFVTKYIYLRIEIIERVGIDKKGSIGIKPFRLKNIDDMRMAILSKHTLGAPFTVGWGLTEDWNQTSGTDQTGLPYTATFEGLENNRMAAQEIDMCGLMLKTYQSDIFNNWLNTEWIDGTNGIAELTKIAVVDGAFKIDALNLAEKLYNVLNRVAVSGNTLDDYQDAVYTESPRKHVESPVFIGGASYEVVFEQIVQNSPSDAGGEETTLGTLGGRGKLIKRKGGHVRVKIDEYSYIIGIVSLTPRLVYTQQNEWDITDLKSLDDVHKPALDGIGFQDLIGEQLLWSDTRMSPNGQTATRSKIGKVPAWINYMTSYDKAYGDFAMQDGKAFMVLARNYEQTDTGAIGDATTYIDPSKFNYAFAYTELAAQNFWVQIDCQITARRLMSAKQIPNI